MKRLEPSSGRRSAAARRRARSGAGTPCRARRSSAGSRSCRAPRRPARARGRSSAPAWTETKPLNVCGSMNWSPGRASSARKSIASRPAIDEEEDRRDEVLDADHLVVGVDLEVVAPAVGAVARVVVRDASACRARSASSSRRRRCRRGSRAGTSIISTVVQTWSCQTGVVADRRADTGAEPGADPEEERRHPERADPARPRSGGASPSARPAGRGARGCRGLRCGSRCLVPLHEILHELRRAGRRGSCAVGGGHDAVLVAGRDVGARVDDRLVDEVLERLAGLLRRLGQVVEVGADLAGRVRPA